jgi:hypothetical protein
VQAEKRKEPEYTITDALENPLDKGNISVDQFGRRALRIIGKQAEVVLNPDKGPFLKLIRVFSRGVFRVKRNFDFSHN